MDLEPPETAWRTLSYLLLAVVLTLAAALLRADEPSTWTVSGNGAITAGSAGEVSQQYSALYRWVLPGTAPAAGWRAVAGVDAEDTRFTGAQPPGTPTNLRSVSADLRVEYWQDDEVEANLALRPGEYYQDRPSSGDEDVPIEAWSGVPIPGLKDLAGVLGLETARFYHHPIPIAGLVWTINPTVRIEAFYPEPALVVTPNKTFTARLGGELIGDGYLARTLLGETPVEYYAYRLGASAQWKSGPINFSAAAGDEVEREFDFFRQRRRIHRGGRAYAELGITWQP